MALLNFDASTVEVTSFDALPAGVYEVVITESKMQETKAGNGMMLVLTLEVISGDYKGRKLWDRLNLQNPNPTAVEIARQTLASICRAIGITKINDSGELHDKPLMATVQVRKTPDGDAQNDIKSYRPRANASQAANKSPAVASSPAPTAAAPRPVTPSTTSPWAR